MTPKEKAIELVEKYKPLVYCYLGSGMLTNTESETVILMNAKECAKINVDEILSIMPVRIQAEYFNYYQEVKQEIEKL